VAKSVFELHNEYPNGYQSNYLTNKLSTDRAPLSKLLYSDPPVLYIISVGLKYLSYRILMYAQY